MKAYTKGGTCCASAIVHNTHELGCGRILAKLPEIITRLADMVERFGTALDCVDVGFLPDRTLDRLPLSAQIGRTRVGGVDPNKPRIRAALAAVLALSASPAGATVADLTRKVHAMTGQTPEGYTSRQAAYDLRKLRGKDLVSKPVRSRRYLTSPAAARTITAGVAAFGVDTDPGMVESARARGLEVHEADAVTWLLQQRESSSRTRDGDQPTLLPSRS